MNTNVTKLIALAIMGGVTKNLFGPVPVLRPTTSTNSTDSDKETFVTPIRRTNETSKL